MSTATEIADDKSLLKSTVQITCADAAGNTMIGTAFFFYNSKKKNLYLVTCRHNIENRISSSFSLPSLKDGSVQLIVINNLPTYVSNHANPDVDMAVIDITLCDPKFGNLYSFYAFYERSIPNAKFLDAIPIDSHLIALGFPGVISGQFPMLSPFVNTCSFMQPPYIPFSTGNFYIMETPLSAGSSGSPIVMRKDNNSEFYLIGMYFFSNGEFRYLKNLHNQQPGVIPNETRGILLDGISGLAVKSELIMDIVR